MTNHYSLQTEFGAEDELFKAIITLDKKRIKKLKAGGSMLTEKVRGVFENGSGRSVSVDSPAYQFWFSLVREIKEMPLEDFSEIAAILRAEIGKPLHYSEALWLWGNKRALEPGFFDVTLENFDQKRMSKKKTMKDIIDKNALGCLPVCEKHGWLKMPKTRDELIEYASKKGNTEAAAWLLEFKNRTADLAAERARAEKKAERELNADPNSLSELKKIWRFEKREDGTIVILGYKGDRTEIVVPERIGVDIVTAIGEYAFSPDAKRIREEQRALRKAITKVTLPDTIERIGEFAFFKCRSLTEINIPERLTEISKGMLDITGLESIIIGGNVRRIGAVAFWGCRDLKYVKLCEGVSEIDVGAFYNCTDLETIELPRSLEKSALNTMSEGAFWNCHKLTALVHKGSYAEKYCDENKITYKYAEE
ncbi:MAG: leucine-rich repeat domain-containing protein [Oscillospiraceae bacterium]|nr:leucine-rich repeat domain-containing protein [Oscillospiraceae bacterium]